MKKETTPATKKDTEAKATKTIDQLSFARMIAQKFNLKLSDVTKVIEEEQRLTIEYVRLNYRVIKKNYLTIESRKYAGKKDWVSPLDGKTYQLPPTTRILIRAGEGFKSVVASKKMPDKLCRFVGGAETTA